MARLIRSEPPDELRYEPTAKHVRAERHGETVVDSRRALLVWEPAMAIPRYAFPREDVHVAAIECDDPDLAGYVTIDWDSVDAWFEEDEEVIAHPRDPRHRIDTLRSSRHVVVEIDGEAVAESRRPVLLFETGLPVRFYLPHEDVRMDSLTPSASHTRCPYKGIASYWSVGDHDDIAWTYEQALEPKIEGLIAFFNERVDLTVDGERQERPRTRWSR